MIKVTRFIKLSGILLVTVATLVTATALFLPYLLDVNAYRSEIVMALQQNLNRPVNFGSGSFAWHFGPSFEFNSFIVKERDGIANFISARKITVQLALVPLLEKKVVLRKLILDETTISLFRNSDGSTNIDDLLKPDKNGSEPLKFRQIHINKGAILWRDMSGRKEPLTAALHNIALTADNVGRGQKGNLKLSGDIPSISGAPTHLALTGKLQLPSVGLSLIESYADCILSVRQVEIGRFWNYFGRFVPFANTGGRLDITTSFKGKPLDFTAKGKIIINGATVTWPTIFHGPLSPKALQLEYTLALNRQLIDISTVDLSMEGFRIRGSFKLHDYLTKDPRIVAKASTPATFRYEDVRNYVPYRLIDVDTADYIENKIKSGIFKLDTGVLDGRISQIANMKIGQNYNSLMIRGTLEKGILSYGPKAPTFSNLKGVIELKGKDFNLVGMSGSFGTSPFSLNGSITEYNTDKTSNYPVKMNIDPQPPEMAWLAKMAGIPNLEYSNSSSLELTGSGPYSAYKLSGDWDLKRAEYNLPGYVNKPLSMPHTLKFSTIIGSESTKVTYVNYNLKPMTVTGSGLIGYGVKPYLGFDLQTNKFEMSEAVPILSMWNKYKIHGTVQANIKGSGDPIDMSAMDYHGTVNITRLSLLPNEQLKELTGISGLLTFKGNSVETTSMPARYGDSIVTVKAAINSLKNPEGDITLSSKQFFLHDINLSKNAGDASIKRLNANFRIGKDSIVINSASGLLNSSNFNFKGLYTTGRSRFAAIAITSSKFDLNNLRLFSSPTKPTDNNSDHGPDFKLSLNIEAGNLDKIAFSKLTATIQRENSAIYLQHLTAGVYGGKLTAKGRMAGGGEQGNRYDMTFDLLKTDGEKLFTALDISSEVTGELTLNGNVTARGNTLLDIKKSALGNVHLSMSSGGMLRKFNTLSKVFSILNISQLLKFKLPDMASGGMPYSSIKGSIAIKDGIMSTQDLFISSNAINMTIIGNADIVKEELNLTIGAQPLQTVDKIVNRIPIVGWLLTGKDKDLLTAYFEAKGKWSDPQVSAIPVKSMGKGVLNIFIRAFELPVKLFTDTGEVILGK